MTKIIFVTSGKIDYEFKGLTLYKSIDLTASGRKFPHLREDSETEIFLFAKLLLKKNPNKIISATSHQCLETAHILSKVIKAPILESEYLLPLKFEIKKIFSEKEFDLLGKDKFKYLRLKFVNMFFENKLTDDNTEIRSRFLKLQKTVKREDTVIVISHAYLIKLFSIYYKLGDKIYKDKKLLVKSFDPEREPMGRLESLEINL